MFQTHAFPMLQGNAGEFLELAMDRACGTSAQATNLFGMRRVIPGSRDGTKHGARPLLPVTRITAVEAARGAVAGRRNGLWSRRTTSTGFGRE
jgi:hypothetical protein